MQIGKMYKPAANHSHFRIFEVNPTQQVYFEKLTGYSRCVRYPLKDLLFVALELSTTTAAGAALLGSDSLRVRALLPDGNIGDIYLSESEWEQV